MLTAVVGTFVIGYLLIVLEHPLKLDKTVPALLAGVLCWTLIAVSDLSVVGAEKEIGDIKDVLLHHCGEIAQILEIPEGTVASRLYHARNALRKALLEMRVEP